MRFLVATEIWPWELRGILLGKTSIFNGIQPWNPMNNHHVWWLKYVKIPSNHQGLMLKSHEKRIEQLTMDQIWGIASPSICIIHSCGVWEGSIEPYPGYPIHWSHKFKAIGFERGLFKHTSTSSSLWLKLGHSRHNKQGFQTYPMTKKNDGTPAILLKKNGPWGKSPGCFDLNSSRSLVTWLSSRSAIQRFQQRFQPTLARNSSLERSWPICT